MTQKDIEKLTKQILSSVDREREREIISRRYGLYDRKETLEQIGELLGITRERVRQLEKATMTRLKLNAEAGEIEGLKEFEVQIIETLKSLGNIARVSKLSDKLTGETSNKIEQSRLSFIGDLSPKLSVISDNDHFFQSIAITEAHSVDKITDRPWGCLHA